MRRYIFWLIFWSILLSGCSLEKRIAKAKVLAYNHPERFADVCSKLYPVVPTYIKGKDSIVEKTVEVKGDSIPCPPNEKGEVVKVKCPDQKIIYQNVYRTDTVEKESTAKLSALQQRYNDLDNKYAIEQDKLSEATKTAKERLWWLIGLIVAIGIGVFLKIKGVLPF